jgi:thiol:disulfide interchange protein DsbC
MRITPLFAASALAALFSLPLAAQTNPEQQIRAELKKALPEASVESVRKVPYGNLYEVVSNGEILYSDEKGSFLLLGPIFDLKTQQNVTEERLRTLNAVKFDALDFNNAIKIVRGNGSRKMAIFEDPNCGYCKRFERDLLGINDVTVYVFLYPILSPDSTEKSKAVWCAPDRAKAWLDLMTRETVPTGDTKCVTTAIEKNVAFGRDKRISGTPTIIFENGDRVPGAMPVAEVEKRLVAARTAPAGAAKSAAPSAPAK